MRYRLIIWLLWVAMASAVAEDHEAAQLLYGTVTTTSGKALTGPLRWDDEEILWTDHFNAGKIDNEFVSLLAPADLEYLESRGPSRIRSVGDLVDLFSRQNRFSDFRKPHSFACRFGDIARLVPQEGGGVRLTLRNGETLLLSDDSNDLGPGTTLQIFDSEAGLKKIRWRDVASVSFSGAPPDTSLPWGAPVYGVLETDAGTLSGYIQWDHDERVSSDVIDGDLDKEDVSIGLRDISAIEKTPGGSKLMLATGESFVLTGTNDVNDDNRGIYVEVASGARVDVPWSAFRRIEFTPGQRPSPSYASFAAPARLAGSVVLRDEQRIDGRFAFDLDESWNIEMLDGRAGSLGYSVPFVFVIRIEVADPDSVRVELSDGSRLQLAHEQDVSERNDGLLLFADKQQPRYVRWLDLASIELRSD